MASLCLGVSTSLSVFVRSMFPRCAISASLSFPDRRGGGGGCVVVGGGAAVVVVTSVVVVTGAAVVRTSAGGSVNPVIMSSAALSSGFTVVTLIAAAVVTMGATVVSTFGASVVMISVSMGGAQETPAASSKVTEIIFMFVSLLASQIAHLHSACRVSGSAYDLDLN